MESKSRGVPNTPLEPVIGLAEGETRWRGMTVSFWSVSSLPVRRRPPLQRLQHGPGDIGSAVTAAEFHRLDAVRIDLVDGALDALAGFCGGLETVLVGQPVQHHRGREKHTGRSRPSLP